MYKRQTLALSSTSSADTSAADGARHPPSEPPGTPSSAEAVVPPSYRRLYDSAMSLLESELELEPYPIPEGLGGNSAVVGKGRSKQVMLCVQCTPWTDDVYVLFPLDDVDISWVDILS